jgi:sec-independent protein translocase protein TatB
MFDIGWSELVVIAVVALIAIGPKELPGVLRSVGYWMGKVRRMASEFQGQFQEAMREAEMTDLKKHADDLNNMAKGLTTDLSSTLDPYDTAKESRVAAASSEVKPGEPKPNDAPTNGTASPDVAAATSEPAPLPASPDYSQVAAMPDHSPAAPEVAPVPEVAPAPDAAPVRRDA